MAAIVILDACVLFPAPLRDLLIRLAAAGLTRARWTEEILDECFRNIHAKRPELNERALTRTRELMNQAVRDPLVRGFEELIHDLTLPDSKDRHVLAAAIAAGAEAIVTFNLRDFPKDQLNAFGIVAVHPDEFVAGLLLTASGSVAEVITEQAVALRNPPRTVRELLDTLRAQGLVRAVPAIADVMGLRNRADNAETGKPLVAMSEIELHSAMDEIVLPLDERVIEQARVDGRHSRQSLGVSVAVLRRLDGQERFAAAESEDGDDEGRKFVGGMVRVLRRRWLERRERLLRKLIRADIESGTYTIDLDPLTDSSVGASAEQIYSAADSSPWHLEVARTDSDVNGRVLRISAAILTRSDGRRRIVLSNIERGDNEGRRGVASFVRKLRRMGVLQPREVLERFMVEAPIDSAECRLVVDPVKARAG